MFKNVSKVLYRLIYVAKTTIIIIFATNVITTALFEEGNVHLLSPLLVIMLGKNIGRKVGANFVNTQYQAFLTNQKDKKNAMNKVEQAVTNVSTGKPPMSKAHKRDEMRKKGCVLISPITSEFHPSREDEARKPVSDDRADYESVFEYSSAVTNCRHVDIDD
uniref:ABC transmembrane type-1 domain-containing protein n=1 Tax=Angiostrongylus cantonensis TaxID=6313 RepID=A0A0K0CZ15_ANGCA